MQYKFETDLENLDHRSVFANRIFKLIYQKCNGDLDLATKEAELFYEELEELVRNFYEIVDTEVPLYALWYLKKHGKDNFGFTQEEFEEKIENATKACHLYYDTAS